MKITIASKEYEVVQFEGADIVESKYKGFWGKGVREIYVVKRRGRIYSVSKFASGSFSKLIPAFVHA